MLHMQASELALALAVTLLAVLALAFSAVPIQVLLRNSRSLRVGVGMFCGMEAATHMALPAMQTVLLAVSGVAPVSTAVAMLVFGPVAGLLSALIVVCVHSLLHPDMAGAGLTLMLATTALAYGWHAVRARGPKIGGLVALAPAIGVVRAAVGACASRRRAASLAMAFGRWRFDSGRCGRIADGPRPHHPIAE